MNFKLAWSIVPLLGAVCMAAEPSDPPARQSTPPDRPQRDGNGGPGPRGPGRSAGGNGDPVTRLMAFDANKDGVLTKDEVNDPRFDRLFDRADADKDGKVTKEELTAAFAKEQQSSPRTGPPGFDAPPDAGPGGQDGPPGGPPDGPRQGNRGPGGGGPGRGRGGPPMPGQVMPPFVQDQLQLDAGQKEKLAALQKEVDAKINEILNDDQKKQLAEMRERRGGPGGGPGAGPGGGPGGGGPGDRPGPPPRRDDGPPPDGAGDRQ